MRRQIAWLVAATTSAVILAFVIPLCLLVRTMAEDRGMAAADQEARNVAVLVSGLRHGPRLRALVDELDQRTPAATSVLTAGGRVLGSPAPGLATDPDVLRARTGSAFTVVDQGTRRILVPVVTSQGTDVVRTVVGPDVLHRGVLRAWTSIVLLGLLLLLAAVVIADRLGRRVSTPVTDLAGVAHRLREGDLDARATPSGPSEVAELGVAMNLLADRVGELLAAERAAVGDLSHRLRTPLTALRLDSEAVDQAELAARLQGHVGQLQRTVDAIVKDARRPVRHALNARCDAAAVVRERASFWSALAEDQGRTVSVRVPGQRCAAAVDPGDLRDVVDVLVDNVFAHTPEGTAFAVTLRRVGGRCLVEVVDEGPGFDDPETLPASAEPPQERPGFSGLGLQIVRRTVATYQGEVVLERGPNGGGTRARVWLPVPPPDPPGPRSTHGQSSAGSDGSPPPPSS